MHAAAPLLVDRPPDRRTADEPRRAFCPENGCPAARCARGARCPARWHQPDAPAARQPAGGGRRGGVHPIAEVLDELLDCYGLGGAAGSACGRSPAPVEDGVATAAPPLPGLPPAGAFAKLR